MKKIIKIISISLVSIVLLLVVGLAIYSSTAYKALDEMYTQIDLIEDSNIIISEKLDHIKIEVENPIANIVFIPGGLVVPEAYMYIAYNLALEGYNVTISKPLFHLAILTPNYTNKFVNNSLENIYIGHSLGGLIASGVSSSNDSISKLILLASYPNKINTTHALSITASNDGVINHELYDINTPLYLQHYETFIIDGGNHAGFGWYGAQKGDSNATITIKEQQDITIKKIMEFIK